MFELFRPYLKGASKVLIVLKRYSLYTYFYWRCVNREIKILIVFMLLFAKTNPILPQDKCTYQFGTVY